MFVFSKYLLEQNVVNGFFVIVVIVPCVAREFLFVATGVAEINIVDNIQYSYICHNFVNGIN